MLPTLILCLSPLFALDAKPILDVPSKALFECDSTVLRVAANDKGVALVAATDKGEVVCWNTTKSLFTWRNPAGGGSDMGAAVHESVLIPRALDVGDEVAFLGSGVPRPVSLDMEKGKESSGYMLLADPSAVIVELCCDPKDRWAWMGLSSGTIVRYVPGGGSQYSRRSIAGITITALANDADASLLAVGCSKGTIHFANSSSANLVDDKVLKGPEIALKALHFASKGTVLLAGNEKGDVLVWNVGTGKVRQTVHASDAAITRIVVHPKNKWFVTGDAAGVVKKWTLDDGAHSATFTCEGATTVHDLEFANGGKTLVGALGGKSVVAWDVSKL